MTDGKISFDKPAGTLSLDMEFNTGAKIDLDKYKDVSYSHDISEAVGLYNQGNSEQGKSSSDQKAKTSLNDSVEDQPMDIYEGDRTDSFRKAFDMYAQDKTEFEF